MGSGDIGSNGSVHWMISYTDVVGAPPDHKDWDDSKRHPGGPPDARPEIGAGKAGPGLLRVTLRFNSPVEATRVLTDALAALKAAPPNTTNVTLDVPIRGYRPQAPNAANRNDWEIGVDW
jgi:hypothetical protein